MFYSLKFSVNDISGYDMSADKKVIMDVFGDSSMA